jgi:hypothetical protein
LADALSSGRGGPAVPQDGGMVIRGGVVVSESGTANGARHAQFGRSVTARGSAAGVVAPLNASHLHLTLSEDVVNDARSSHKMEHDLRESIRRLEQQQLEATTRSSGSVRVALTPRPPPSASSRPLSVPQAQCSASTARPPAFSATGGGGGVIASGAFDANGRGTSTSRGVLHLATVRPGEHLPPIDAMNHAGGGNNASVVPGVPSPRAPPILRDQIEAAGGRLREALALLDEVERRTAASVSTATRVLTLSAGAAAGAAVDALSAHELTAHSITGGTPRSQRGGEATPTNGGQHGSYPGSRLFPRIAPWAHNM